MTDSSRSAERTERIRFTAKDVVATIVSLRDDRGMDFGEIAQHVPRDRKWVRDVYKGATENEHVQ